VLISAQARAMLKRANRSIWRRMVVVFKTGHLNNRKGPFILSRSRKRSVPDFVIR
jgi:hypothetical protein